MTKEDALILMLQEWEVANDLDPIEEEVISIHTEPARKHIVKKVRDKTLQEVANLIRKFQLDDPRSKEILERAEQVQRKVYRKPRKNRKGGGRPNDHRFFYMDTLEPIVEHVRSAGDIHAPVVEEQVQSPRSGASQFTVPSI